VGAAERNPPLGFENFQKMVGFACAAPTLFTEGITLSSAAKWALTDFKPVREPKPILSAGAMDYNAQSVELNLLNSLFLVYFIIRK